MRRADPPSDLCAAGQQWIRGGVLLLGSRFRPCPRLVIFSIFLGGLVSRPGYAPNLIWSLGLWPLQGPALSIVMGFGPMGTPGDYAGIITSPARTFSNTANPARPFTYGRSKKPQQNMHDWSHMGLAILDSLHIVCVCRHLDHLQIVCLCLNNKNRLSVMVGFDVGVLVCNSALFPKIKVSAFGSYSTVEPT